MPTCRAMAAAVSLSSRYRVKGSPPSPKRTVSWVTVFGVPTFAGWEVPVLLPVLAAAEVLSVFLPEQAGRVRISRMESIKTITFFCTSITPYVPIIQHL